MSLDGMNDNDMFGLMDDEDHSKHNHLDHDDYDSEDEKLEEEKENEGEGDEVDQEGGDTDVLGDNWGEDEDDEYTHEDL